MSQHPPLPELPALHPAKRLLLLVVGWLLVLVGLAGLVLPGIQGVLTLGLGAAALSLVSNTFLKILHEVLWRWPRAFDTMMRFRQVILGKLGVSRTDTD